MGRKYKGDFPITHGPNQTTEYNCWSKMRRRCHNPKDTAYPAYGAKGISVCAEWRNDFMAFYKHVGPRPSKNYSIDRIDGRGNYEPGNVKWSTFKEQAFNRPNWTHVLELDGEVMCLTDWARRTGLSTGGIRSRIERGWSVRDALMTPTFQSRAKRSTP